MSEVQGLAPSGVRKPLNIFCILAGIAFLMGAVQTGLVIEVRQFISGDPSRGQQVMMGVLIWQALTALVSSAVRYGGLALAIELIDQVRWRLIPEAERPHQRSRYLLVRFLRTATADV